MPLTRVLIFTAVLSLLSGLVHFGISRILERRYQLKSRWLTRALPAGSAILLVLALPLTRHLPPGHTPEVGRALILALYYFVAWVFILCGLVVLTELPRWAGRAYRSLRATGRQRESQEPDSEQPSSQERRLQLERGLGLLLGVGSLGLLLDGARRARAPFLLPVEEFMLEKLPQQFDGYRVVQISDIHVGPTVDGQFLRRIVDQVNRLQPDIVVITGDLVDGSVEQLGEEVRALSSLQTRDGVYFVTGNHEYYSGAAAWLAKLPEFGVIPLHNRRVELQRGGTSIDLAGVADHRAGAFGDPPSFAQALAGRDPSRELLLLAHQPAAWDEAAQHDVGLQLSGHTHGGQIWPGTWIVGYVQPISQGRGRKGRTQIYVNTGTAYWGPAVRSSRAPEITTIILRAPRATV